MALPVAALVIMISSCLFDCSKTSSSFLERLLNEPFLVFVSCSLMFFVASMNGSIVWTIFVGTQCLLLLLNLYSSSDSSACLRKS